MLNNQRAVHQRALLYGFGTIRIRTAIVDGVLGNADEAIDAATNVTVEAEEGETTGGSMSDGTLSTLNKDATVEEVIQTRLSNFFNKRKASGDARPCGPHDMLPIYLSVIWYCQGRVEK